MNESDLIENQENKISFANDILNNRNKFKCGALDHTKTKHLACPLNKKFKSKTSFKLKLFLKKINI